MMRAQIVITLKPGILDPQGRAVQQSLQSLGFASVEAVRIGKVLEVDIRETDRAVAGKAVQAMCDTLLANPVIENYRVELLDVQDDQ